MRRRRKMTGDERRRARVVRTFRKNLRDQIDTFGTNVQDIGITRLTNNLILLGKMMGYDFNECDAEYYAGQAYKQEVMGIGC